jgi:hypothetical protein
LRRAIEKNKEALNRSNLISCLCGFFPRFSAAFPCQLEEGYGRLLLNANLLVNRMITPIMGKSKSFSFETDLYHFSHKLHCLLNGFYLSVVIRDVRSFCNDMPSSSCPISTVYFKLLFFILTLITLICEYFWVHCLKFKAKVS